MKEDFNNKVEEIDELVSEEVIEETPIIEEPFEYETEIPLPDEEDIPEEEQIQYSMTDLLDELTAERDEYKNKYLLALADFDNYKKRSKNAFTTFETAGMTKVLLSMFQVMDDFERAIKMNENNEDIESIKSGFELIYKRIMTSFESMNVKKIDTENQDFDTDYHEAVTMFDGTEEQKNKVVDCVQTGYTLNDKVIRHAKVVVGK